MKLYDPQSLDTTASKPLSYHEADERFAEVIELAGRNLPDRQWACFCLYWEYNLTPLQIACILRISPNTVNTHLRRALALLRRRVQKHFRA